MIAFLFAALLAPRLAMPTGDYRALCTELAQKKQLRTGMTVEQCIRQLASTDAASQEERQQAQPAPIASTSATLAQDQTQPVRLAPAFGHWLILGVVAFCLHTATALVLRNESYGGPNWSNAPSLGGMAAAALLWPFQRIRSQPVPRPEMDVPVSLFVAVVELAFTTWAFVALSGWVASLTHGIAFGLLVVVVLAVAAIPVVLLSWLASGLFVVIFRVLLGAMR